jgi:hypothetical protein
VTTEARPYVRELTRHSRLQLLGNLLALIACAVEPAAANEATCAYTDIHPTYPPPNAPPSVQVTEVAGNASAPSGANCFAEHNPAATWTTVSSVVRTLLTPDELMQRFGAISQLPGLLYWSTTDEAWRPMISAAFAVDSADAVKPRADYSFNELITGTVRYYRVTDTRTREPINYRLQVRPSPPGHLVVETTNVEPIKKWGITLYKPDGLRTLYFLNQRSPNTWSYYSITRAIPATFLAKGHEKSYINRAVALYRHYMRLPITDEPPAAP